MQAVESGEIQISTICDIEGSGLVRELVENVDIVNLAGGKDHDGGEVAPQGQQGVQFDGGFVPPKFRPRKQRQTQVDGGRVHRPLP